MPPGYDFYPPRWMVAPTCCYTQPLLPYSSRILRLTNWASTFPCSCQRSLELPILIHTVTTFHTRASVRTSPSESVNCRVSKKTDCVLWCANHVGDQNTTTYAHLIQYYHCLESCTCWIFNHHSELSPSVVNLFPCVQSNSELTTPRFCCFACDWLTFDLPVAPKP